jgi:hypothetical protein
LKRVYHSQSEGITLELVAGILVESDAHFKTGPVNVALERQRKIGQGALLEVIKGQFAVVVNVFNTPLVIGGNTSG